MTVYLLYHYGKTFIVREDEVVLGIYSSHDLAKTAMNETIARLKENGVEDSHPICDPENYFIVSAVLDE